MAGEALLMVVDGNGVVVEWSRLAQHLVGYPAEQVVGQSVAHLATQATAEPARGNARPGRTGVVLRGTDGRAVGDLRVRPMKRQDGTVAWAFFQAGPGRAPLGDLEAAAVRAWFGRAPAGLYVLDTGLRIVSADLATQIIRVPAQRVLGRRLTDVYSLPDPSQIEAMLGEVLESGAPVPERIVRMHCPEAPGGPRWARVWAFRLEDEQGAVQGVATVLADVSEVEQELEHKRARLRLLSEVRALMGQALDVVTACQELADALVPNFADAAVVEVVDSVVRGEDPPLAPLGREVPLRRASCRYIGGEAKVQAHPVGDVRKLPFPGPYAQTLTDLKPRIVDLRQDAPWLAADPERAAAIRRSGVRTLFAVPLTLHGAVLGLLSLYRTEQPCSFDDKEVNVALALATMAAVSIDNARLYTREHTIAATIQRQLLPVRPSSQTGIETADARVFGEAGGGGWSDTFNLACARTAVVVGEVSGHGLQAATAMGELRTVVRSLARLNLEPDELLARLNDTAVLLAAERAALPPSDPSHREPLTASCVYAVYDPLTQTCIYALAHHPAPVIISPGGTPAELPDAPAGPALGTADGLPFTAAAITLDPGSILAFYTRSILPPAPDSGPDDLRPLQQILAGTKRPLQDLCDEVIYSLRDGPRPGDAVLHLARTRTFPPSQVSMWPFGPDAEAAGRARANVRHQLAAWHIDDETAQATELVVAELVTNAIRYGNPPMWLRIVKDLTISCEVHDGNPVTPYLCHPGTLDEFGRGLVIVGRLVQAWGTRRAHNGKTVWAEVALPGQPADC